MEINSLFSVKGKTAIVTGGSRGIGEMIASGFLANGVKVYISARKAPALIEKANELSEWKYGYVIDSLGWAYFLNQNYEMAEKYLKLAYEKAPYEVEVYDHYGDVLWMSGEKIQARYYWRYVLNLEDTKEDYTSTDSY